MSARLGLLNEYECCTTTYSHEYECTHEYNRSEPSQSLVSSSGLLVFSSLAAKLGVVALLDSLDGRLELGLVGAHHDEDAQVERVHVRVGEQALR